MSVITEFKRMIVHHSASRLETTVDDIRDWHVNGNGWADIGYHYVITMDGEIHQGRPLPMMGAHARGCNRDSIGVCLVGDNLDPQNKWLPEQVDSLHRIWGCAELMFPGIELYGHRDVGNTQCPGLDVYKLIYGKERDDGIS